MSISHGRNRTNIWTYAGTNAFGPDRATDLAMHPTVKPVALVADAILDSTRGGIILDPFLGSGTSVIAAHRTGRRGFGMEFDPWYVDVAVQRISAAVSESAIHFFSGLTFDELQARQRGGCNG
jgi:DNA modification methylase